MSETEGTYESPELELPWEPFEFLLLFDNCGEIEWENVPGSKNHVADLSGLHASDITLVEGDMLVRVLPCTQSVSEC